MNVTEFAERVVFGTTLEEKLLEPGRVLTFTDPNVPHPPQSLKMPGRPVGLEMQFGSGSVQPPSDNELENESARGRLLHFLANHELLATELMALVLLKFPDAPAAFRQGILVTLREEQLHTRLYLKRMRECGIEFGSFPLSGHFWRIVEPMQSPMDFVSRLSLTFEQANLDYSQHFAGVFRRLGDKKTAAILERIYQDEIGHVRHGLEWFRKWKNPKQSDWEAYQSCLEFPMSPQRARGPHEAFNRQGRLQAGLTEEFIDAVEVFRQSRGRTPTVHWFDPGAEAELERDLDDKERRLMNQLGEDLECLVVVLAKRDDVVLVRRPPSQAFCKHLIDAGFELPEFIHFAEADTLCRRKLSSLSPWAWTPKNHAIAEPLLGATRQRPPSWNESRRDMFRKTWSAARLMDWYEERVPDWFTSVESIGLPVRDVEDVCAALRILAERGFETALFKKDLATAGRGQRRLPCRSSMKTPDKAWLKAQFEARIKATGQAVAGIVEPELKRELDLSFLWFLPPKSEAPDFLGWTRPLVTDGRRYAGTRLGRPFDECETDIKKFLLEGHYARLHAVKDWLSPRVTRELQRSEFTGYFGIDALVCRDANQLRIKPLVELNPRLTMGHIALRLAQRIAPGVPGDLRILTRKELANVSIQRKDGTNSTTSQLKRSSDGRWQDGVVRLGELCEHTRLAPVVLVGAAAIEAASVSAR